jgi:hypothetical protein
MFSQPIVFVVGAGASAEFGMPTGSEMKSRIAKVLNFNRGANGLLIGDRAVFDMLGARFGARELEKHLNAATELAIRIEEFESIDEALHWFSARPEIVALGKIAIVLEILRSEGRSKLSNPANPELIRETNYSDTWLPSFLSMVVGSLTREQARQAFRNVTIVNFNYDRIIEHFLFSRLQTNFGLNANEAIEAISSLKMIRPYGSVGRLPWQKGAVVPFGARIDLDHEKLFELSNNVRTYTEQDRAAELEQKIRSAIDSSRIVVFLGFGFHQQNMTLLRATNGVDWRRVLATVLGIDHENYETLKLQIATTVGAPLAKVQVLGRDSRSLLPSMKPTLMAVL